jgi:hypothetical protein
MDEMTTFTSDKESLQDILKSIRCGKYQLPEFQRGWVWDDIHIISLLASVSLSYPIGAVMMLENGNPDVRFKPRPVEGVDLPTAVEPERFILDGQQRLTSLFQALSLTTPVKTRDIRKREIHRWYYIDMQKALSSNGDREDAISSLPEDRIVRNFRNEVLSDYSTPQAEFKYCLFPVNQLLDPSAWRREFNKAWQHSEEKSNLFDEFEKAVIERFKQYQVPVIKLLKQTPKIAVCQVFEKVNTGGVSLTVFELVTASFAAEGYNLREDWEGKHDERGRKIGPGRKDLLHKQAVLRSVGADELLQTISLLRTYERKQKDKEAPVSCKRADILKLKLDDYNMSVEKATIGFEQAGRFLFQQKIFTNRDLPYTTQLVPLSAVLAILGERAENDALRNKLVRWFWCGVFGQMYGSAIETRVARDVMEIMAWVDSGPEPSTVTESQFPPNRLETSRTRNSAAYKGLYALLMRDGCLDFRTGVPIEVQSYFSDAIDIHHIFPRAWCQKNRIEARLCDSIINKTALSDRTNRMIGGSAPATYLQTIRDKENIDEHRQGEILASHVINVSALHANDFKAFYDARKEALLRRIEKATGKMIGRMAGTAPDPESSDDDEPDNSEETT